MENPFAGLTGDALMKQMRHQAKVRIFRTFIILIVLTAICVCGLIAVSEDFREFGSFLLILPFLLLGYILCFHYLRKQRGILALGENNEVFYRFGTPDEIAAILSDPDNIPAFNSQKVILTDKYVMMRKDFTTFVPLTEIENFSILHTSGKHQHLYFVVFSKDGRKIRYDFEEMIFGWKKERTRGEIAAEYIKTYAPDCTLYSCYEERFP